MTETENYLSQGDEVFSDNELRQEVRKYRSSFFSQISAGLLISGSLTVLITVAVKREAMQESLIVAGVCMVLGLGIYFTGINALKGGRD